MKTNLFIAALSPEVVLWAARAEDEIDTLVAKRTMLLISLLT